MLAAGFGSSAAVLTNGSVVLWGSTFDYVMTPSGPGPNTVLTVPTPIAGLDGAYSVTVGADHACGLLSNSEVKCWGHNEYGQLGNNTSTDSISTPVDVVGL
jgi:large repetitive protein